MPIDVHAVSFTKAHHDVTGHPHLVGGGAGTFAEDLEFPLAFGNFSVDAFDIDAGVEAKVNVLLGQFASHTADALVTNAGVVFTLRVWISITTWEAERSVVLPEEIFLFETKPCTRVIMDGCTAVAWVRSLHVRHV